MIIRLANEHDVPGLLRLLRQVGQVHHEIRPDIFRDGALKYDENALAELLRDENRPVFVSARDDQILGYCFCIRRGFGDGVMVPRKEIYIDDLCVEETCRGQGIATALYRHVCAWAKEEGCAFITLNVWNGNDSAMAFYEKMGMRPRSVTMDFSL